MKNKKCTHCPLTDQWDDHDSMCYNAWLRVFIEPTRYINWFTVRRMGLEQDLCDMISELGLGTMPSGTHDLYPALVRQFMATAQVSYTNERARRAREGTLSLFARGIRYRISITDLFDIYGFQNPTSTPCAVHVLPGISEFWGIY